METLLNGLTFFSPPPLQGVTTDSILLAAFAAEHLLEKRAAVCDLCCGSGLLTLLTLARTPRTTFRGVDCDPNACRRYEQNAQNNQLLNRMSAVCADLTEIRRFFSPGAFDAVIANPPYFEAERGAASPDETRRISRQGCPLETVLSSAAYLLKNGGHLNLCFPAARLAELFSKMSAAWLEPKRLRLAAHTVEKAPSIALVEGVRGARSGLICEPLLILYDSSGRMTETCAALYGEPPCENERSIL